MGQTESETFFYRINRQDFLVELCPNWDDFASRNEAPELCERRVLNRPLKEFVSGAETQHFYEIMLAKVRKTLKPITIPFRCDGPRVRRFMELTMLPLQGNGIEFLTVVSREEGRDPVRLLDKTFQRSEERISMCAWCKRVRIGTEWFEVEAAVETLRLFDTPSLPKLTHGICDTCQNLLENQLRE